MALCLQCRTPVPVQKGDVSDRPEADNPERTMLQYAMPLELISRLAVRRRYLKGFSKHNQIGRRCKCG